MGSVRSPCLNNGQAQKLSGEIDDVAVVIRKLLKNLEAAPLVSCNIVANAFGAAAIITIMKEQNAR